MLVKISKIRFKLTEKERNFTWNSGFKNFIYTNKRDNASANKLTTPHHKIHNK